MGKSVSVTLGRGSLNHNNRVFSTENVDPNLTKNNVVFKCQSLKDAYKEIFGSALAEYNNKQKRSDRKIPDYLEHIRKSKNGEKEYHELVIQVGDRYDTGIQTADAQLAQKILTQYYEQFIERNPNMSVFNAVLHMDEPDGTPHLHIDFVPVATRQKRGLEIKNSMRQALEQQGYDFKPTYVNSNPNLSVSYAASQPKIGGGRWLDAERTALGAVLTQNGIVWDNQNTHREHMTVREYKACAELIEKTIEAIPPAVMEMREPTRPMRIAGVKDGEVIVQRSSVEEIKQENSALRTQAEIDRQTIRRMDKEKTETDVFVQRNLKSATITAERAEKEAAAAKKKYSVGTAEKYNELVRKYNKLDDLFIKVKAGFEFLEQQNTQLKSDIPKQIEKAVIDATIPLQQGNIQLRTELNRWQQTASALQEKVRGLCQTIVEIMLAVFTLKYTYKDKPNPYKSALTTHAEHLIDALERKAGVAIKGAQQPKLAERLSGMSVSDDLQRDVQSSMRPKPKAHEIGG